jgi:muramoyltetrapeptide carboxypeptidase
MLSPSRLKPGDKLRFISPASPPDKDAVLRSAAILERWGFTVDYGEHAFDRDGYLAGNDDQRAADLNAALRDPAVRAVFATRGGRGSYRIADRIDFDAVRRDPKFLVGFSDITILHLMLWKQCKLIGVHGSIRGTYGETAQVPDNDALRSMLTGSGRVDIRSRPDERTAPLTTHGKVQGRLIGGNLDMIATAAGWALPDLSGAIVLMEAVEMRLGQVDRQLTMLRKSGHFDGIAAVAVGQFTNCSSGVIEVVRDHLHRLGVPVLAGLPIGHGANPVSVPIGTEAELDADAGTLSILY